MNLMVSRELAERFGPLDAYLMLCADIKDALDKLERKERARIEAEARARVANDNARRQ